MKAKAVFLVALAALSALAQAPGVGRPGDNRWPEDFGLMARRHIKALVAIGPRPAGTANENRAADYIAGQFRAMGIPSFIEPFAFESFEPAAVELRVGPKEFRPVSLGLDPYSRGLTYSGNFIVLDPRAPAAWPSPGDISGKAVVTSEAGDPSIHFRIAALGPRVIIGLAPGDFDRVRGLKGRELTLTVRGELMKATSRNVIARLGPDPPAPQIIVGAHMDAYRDNPGANDNASGVAALVELARYFKRLEIPEGIGLTFVAFGGEEVGLVGSRRFVERHAADLEYCRLALVLDDLGGPGPVLVERDGGRPGLPEKSGVGLIPRAYQGRAWEGLRYPWKLVPPPALFEVMGVPHHPAWLLASIEAAVKELGFDVQFTGIQGSDQMSFAQAGVATSGVSAPNGSGHTQNDTPETVDIGKVRQCTETAGWIIQEAWNRLPPVSPIRSLDPGPDHTPEDSLWRANAMACVRFLASDELRGRRAGSHEGSIAARYLAERLRAAGVEAFPGAPDYFQGVLWRTDDAPPASPTGQSSVPRQARNVVGFIPGRDPSLAGEFVLLMAHHDHLGAQQVEGAAVIFNGARDNAMGVAALLTAAEALALRPPSRSVLILATTAEEEGLVGSRFFVEHPLVALHQVLFVLNNDGAGVSEPALWCLGGLERTTAGPLADAAGRAHGLVTRPYPEKYRYLFEKGDAAPFAGVGIPSLTVSPGFTEGQEDLLTKYVHRPADRVDADFDEAYLFRFCLAYADLARAIADAKTVPSWLNDYLVRPARSGRPS